MWEIVGYESEGYWAAKGAALARAWELTPPGGKRPEVRQYVEPVQTPPPSPSPSLMQPRGYQMSITPEYTGGEEIMSWDTGVVFRTSAELAGATIEITFPMPMGMTREELLEECRRHIEVEATARGMKLVGGMTTDIQYTSDEPAKVVVSQFARVKSRGPVT